MASSDQITFAERLRALREAAELTQTELAERAGLHRQAIAKLELSEREPAWSTAVSLADALGVSLDAFRKEKGKASKLTPKRPSTKRKGG